ncbi:MAG: hypothetical protein U0L43_12675 [Muribaculaceae bacterium]|nr:hypothetical protein [Muribaculaceae bacterium]
MATLGIVGINSTLFSLAQTFSHTLQNSRRSDWKSFVHRKFLAADVECIESVGAVFKELFFRFGKFFSAFILAVIAFGALLAKNPCGYKTPVTLIEKASL